MSRSRVDPQLLAVALDHATGTAFEDFVSEFSASLVGVDYVPVGGTKDGGADGYITDHLREEVTRPGHFVQTSIQPKVQTKIRHTVERLREVARDPKLLTYFSNRELTNAEALEYELSLELQLIVRIRDRKYLSAHINHNSHTQAAFDHHLSHFTAFLLKIGASTVISESQHVKYPDVFVFLRQEVDRRAGAPLVDAVLDTLIVWALEGTDPKQGIFMTTDKIKEQILTSFPSAKPYLGPRLDDRLQVISSKRNPHGGRLIKWHSRDGAYVLPYETRERIALDNAEDELLRSQMLDSLIDRFAVELSADRYDDEPKRGALIALRALQLSFEREGLEFARFVSREDGGPHYHYLTDAVAEALAEEGLAGDELHRVGDVTMEVLRLLFYRSREVEREYLRRLSRTYAILFTLQSEPRLIEYFEEMRGTFYLYVGSDLLIRTLSERYLAPPDQITRNMLAMAATAGATLVLTEPVLNEVVYHIRATDFEFSNHVSQSEQHVTAEIARQSSRILIRSYFYARLGISSGEGPFPMNWPAYVRQFCDPELLHKKEAFAEVRRYLQSQYSLKYESRQELEGLVSLREVAELSEDLRQVKRSPELADNDALMCHAVYGRREVLGESSGVSEFGYRTWWLTGGETSILQYTDHIAKAHHGERYIMRPEFLLNYISLSPKAAEARETFKNVFPTLLGIRVARRMDEGSFRTLMDVVEEAASLEPGRRQAKIAQLVDALKGDMQRQYHTDFVADIVFPEGEAIRPKSLRVVAGECAPH